MDPSPTAASRGESRKRALEDWTLQKFREEAQRQELKVQKAKESLAASLKAHRATKRHSIMSHFICKAKQAKQNESTFVQRHLESLAHLNDIERQALGVELAFLAKRRQCQTKAKEKGNIDVVQGIEQFEALAVREASGEKRLRHPAAHLQQYPPKMVPGDLSKEAIDEPHVHTEHLVRVTAHESSIREVQMLADLECTEMESGRVQQEAADKAKVEAEWVLLCQKEEEDQRIARENSHAAAGRAQASYRTVRQQQQKKRHDELNDFAMGMALEAIDVAGRVSDCRAQNNWSKVPDHVWRPIRHAFVVGDNTAEQSSQDNSSMLGIPCPPADEGSLLDYIRWKGQWQAAGSQTPADDASIGPLVAQLAAACRELPPKQTLNLLFPLKLSVVGPPMAGKSMLAKSIANQYNLQVLEPEAMIDFVIEEHRILQEEEVGKGTEIGNARSLPIFAELGGIFASLKSDDKAVPDEVLVRLVGAVATNLSSYTPVDQSKKIEQVQGKSAKALPAKVKAAKGGAAPAATEFKGFVLDGFPANAAQAALLEKTLTGLDLDEEESFRGSASLLAPPPEGSLPDPKRSHASGLDVAIALALSDTQVLFRRAEGRKTDLATGTAGHSDASPSPTIKEAGDTDPFSVRLAAYEEGAAQLEQFYSRFKCSFWQPVPGDNAPETVAAAAKVVVEHVLKARADAAHCQAAEVAANAASGVAEKALEQAALARTAAEGAARDLLLTKTAELQALALLQQKGTDSAAGDLLKAKAAEKCADLLGTAVASASESRTAAKVAEEAADSAAAALYSCGKDDEKAVSAEARASAEAARTKAATASDMAAKTAQKAQEAANAAHAVLQDAQAKLAAPEPLTPKGKDADPPPATKKTTVVAPQQAQDTPEAKGVSACPLPHAVEKALYEQWRLLEATYLTGIRSQLGVLQDAHQRCCIHYESLETSFAEWLRRPAPDKEELVTSFHVAFNGIDCDLRSLPQTQGELLLRCKECRDALWDICDKRQAENDSKGAAASVRDFLDNIIASYARALGAILQMEVDFLHGLTAFAITWAYASTVNSGGAMPSQIPEPPCITAGIVPPTLASHFDKKKGSSFPDWTTSCEKRAPNLAMAARSALAYVATLDKDPMTASRPGSGTAAAPKKDFPKGAAVHTDGQSQEAAASALIAAWFQNIRLRTQTVLAYAQVIFSDADAMADASKGRISKWIQAQHQAECASVAALYQLASTAAEKGTGLPATLQLRVDDLLVVDEPPAMKRPTLKTAESTDTPPTQVKETCTGTLLSN